MLPTTIEVQGASPVLVTNLQVVGATSSTYSDPGQPAATPLTLKVSHETSKDGSIINSAVIIRRYHKDAVTGKEGYAQATFKVTTNTDVVTKEDLKVVIRCLSFMLAAATATSENESLTLGTDSLVTTFDLDQFLNQEH